MSLLALAMMLTAADRPNILFAISDDQSYPHCSAYGCEWVSTPAFDRVASRGLLFNRCYTPNAKCAPSRACILSGRNSWQLRAAGNHVFLTPPEMVTWVEALGRSGYRTGHVAKGLSPAISQTADGEPRLPTGPAFNDRKTDPPTTAINRLDYAANFKDFLNSTDGPPADSENANRPWCFWYGGFEPHRSYEFGSGLADGRRSPDDIDEVPAYWPDNTVVRTDMLDYSREIEHFDMHLGRMLDELEARGELENTLVIVTSDNGMPFPRVKGNAYERSNHLPLAVMWPAGITEPGRQIDDFVSFIDFAPTLLDYAGVDAEDVGMHPLTGQTLRPIFESDAGGQTGLGRKHVLIGKERHDLGRPGDAGYPVRGIVGERFTYLQNFAPDRWPAGNPETGYMNTDGSPTKTVILDQRAAGLDLRYWALCFGKVGSEELYDRVADPECLNNLANRPAFAETKYALARRMSEELLEEGDPRMLGHGDVFDSYPYADERMRGFYEKFTSGWKDDRGRPLKAGWINETDIEPVEE